MHRDTYANEYYRPIHSSVIWQHADKMRIRLIGDREGQRDGQDFRSSIRFPRVHVRTDMSKTLKDRLRVLALEVTMRITQPILQLF